MSTGVKRHGLLNEGAPFDYHGERIGSNTVRGFGRAKCSCGALSLPYDTAAQRRRWHRTHKAGSFESDEP